MQAANDMTAEDRALDVATIDRRGWTAFGSSWRTPSILPVKTLI